MTADRTQRILTTHVGSLPRPVTVLDRMKAKLKGEPVDAAEYEAAIRAGVAEIVAQQRANGVDVVSDGETSKPGFFTYVSERLEGFEARPGAGTAHPFAAEVNAFPEYYAEYFKRAMYGGTLVPVAPMFCVGPVRYRGESALQRDLDNLKAALGDKPASEAFVPAVAPAGVGTNAYYQSEEEYLHAVGSALRTEYQTIVDAGFILQVDDPFLADVFVDASLTPEQIAKKASLHVEVINAAIAGIPAEKVRLHVCYGINEGPRIHEAALGDYVDYMLRVDAGYYSFEAANCRHEHEYHLWEDVKLPPGKVILPGVITHASNIVEHHELIAERLVRFANLVGREQVMASADCGFSSQACYHTEVHPTVMWAKFRSMAEGARLASQRLWK